MPGHDLLRRWREEGLELPVVILSSRTDETGIVKALELGADDYVTKPFGMKELVARIRVALRHKFQQQGEKPIFQTGDLSVDLVKRIVRLGERKSSSRRRSTTSFGSSCSTPARCSPISIFWIRSGVARRTSNICASM